jgi:hypothetical protein
LPTSRIITKGLNNIERAQLLIDKASAFDSPCFIEADYSRFDAHVCRDKLQAEHATYIQASTAPDQLKWLLDLQLKNKCRTTQGIKYETVGKRMSGDMNTALGNCLINVFTICYVCHKKGVKADFFVDGDDSVIIIEQRDAHLIQAEDWDDTGFKCKMAKTNSITKVEFCKCKIINTALGPRFIPNPLRIMSHYSTTTKRSQGKFWLRKIKADGQGLLALYGGVPILQAIALMMIRLAGNVKPADFFSLDGWHKYIGHKSIEAPITAICRVELMEAWNLNIGEQMFYEDYLNRVLPGNDIPHEYKAPATHMISLQTLY